MSYATLEDLSSDLAASRTTSRILLEECLARVEDPSGEGARTFIEVNRQQAIHQASSIDQTRTAGRARSKFAGIPISVKDLFDVTGQVTRAGSTVLAAAPAATRDATAISRLREAGFVIVGRTNMTEFAYSGLGLNPHFGTPRNPWDRPLGRIPGGSSSGAAVSVTDGMAFAALGTDTGGSCRIPAALTGLVGFKPTACRVPRDGIVPLSPTLDSVGVLTASVDCAAALFDILADDSGAILRKQPLSGVKLAIAGRYVFDGMDQTVRAAFDSALTKIRHAGARVSESMFKLFEELPGYNAKGGFAAAESYHWHRALLKQSGDLYDPRVRQRIMQGIEQSAADYIELTEKRRTFIDAVGEIMTGYDAMLMPTTPLIAPPISELENSDDLYRRTNALLLRNCAVVNFFDGCAVSIPIHEPGTAPVGIMIAAPAGADEKLLSIAGAIEELFPRR